MYQYPLHFLFKLTNITNDFTATDATVKTILFVREKFFKLRDHIKVFRDESREEVVYDMVSNKIIDFQQTFTIANTQQHAIGKVRKKTLRSFLDRKSTRLNSSHVKISYAVFCLKKKNNNRTISTLAKR